MVDGIHFLGIRHHGPGSAKNVKAYLEELEPDIILLEGPPEAEPLLARVLHEQMKPPVALLAYQPDEPRRAVFYPFAEFSPEWQSMCYAVRREVPLRFFDLPLVHHLAFWKEREEQSVNEKSGEGGGDEIPGETFDAEISGKAVVSAVSELLPVDPFAHLAKAAGYDEPELWWEVNFENRQHNEEVFAAVKEAVSVLREYFPKTDRETLLREAWMRKMIRAAQKEGFKRIAVVCGAWHVPGLEKMPTQKEDNELLKGLPKVKVECTWIPWTYDRLSFRSGYGAGIVSPGWYDHLWHYPDDDGTRWMSKVAALFRTKGMDISVAHVIEAVRLAQVAAALRGLPRPSLEEYNDAVTTVMGFGDSILLQVIREALVISDRMGCVPDDVPKVPLLVDVEKLLKRLRLPLTTEVKEFQLDLRKPMDLERSIFFHRLNLLGIKMACPLRVDGKGTFKEAWSVYYEPEQTLAVIEKAVWGNTLSEAVVAYNTHLSKDITSISELVGLLERVIPARFACSRGRNDVPVGCAFRLDNRCAGDDEDYPRYGERGSLRECAEFGLREGQRYAERHDGPCACWGSAGLHERGRGCGSGGHGAIGGCRLRYGHGEPAGIDGDVDGTGEQDPGSTGFSSLAVRLLYSFIAG